MNLFGNVVRNVLNEGYENGGIYLYHMTDVNAVDSMARTGFERFFLNKNSTAFGPVVYTTFWPSIDPRSEVSDPNYDRNHRADIYGHAMLKFKLVGNGFEDFVIYDINIARNVYGSNWRIKDQLEVLLDRRDLEDIKANHSREYHTIVDSHDMWHSGRVPLQTLISLLRNYPVSNRKIKGYIYHGRGDGFVVMPKNFRRLLPVGVSSNYGKSFKPIKIGAHYFDYAINNEDIWMELNVEYDYDVKTYRKLGYSRAYYDFLMPYFYGDFALVEKGGKKNYLYRKDYKRYIDGRVIGIPMTNVWFDDAPDRFIPEGTSVVIDGVGLIVKQLEDGEFYIYLGEDDNVYDKDIMICPLRQFNMNIYYQKKQELENMNQDNNKKNPKWVDNDEDVSNDTENIDFGDLDMDLDI